MYAFSHLPVLFSTTTTTPPHQTSFMFFLVFLSCGVCSTYYPFFLLCIQRGYPFVVCWFEMDCRYAFVPLCFYLCLQAYILLLHILVTFSAGQQIRSCLEVLFLQVLHSMVTLRGCRNGVQIINISLSLQNVTTHHHHHCFVSPSSCLHYHIILQCFMLCNMLYTHLHKYCYIHSYII